VTFPSVFTITFVVLLVLKLTHQISISWWWVFSPLIIGLFITFVFIFIVVVALLLQRR
jgi:hypothetical protein